MIAGLGAACALAAAEIDLRARHLIELRDRLERSLAQRYPRLVIHGARVERLPNTSYCAIPGVDANGLLAALEGVAAAAGSACDTGSVKPSRVLSEMGVAPEIAHCTLRLCVGRDTTVAQIDEAVRRIAAVADGG